MVQRIFILLILPLLFVNCKAKSSFDSAKGDPPSNEIYNELLKKYVTPSGVVNYAGLQKEEAKLDEYLELLSNHPPNKESWTEQEQIAYWINVYNAFTLKLILKHYPVESIKDIAGNIPFVNTPWDVKFIKIGGEEYDLNNVEHGILRKQFDEPRIHVAVNCASVSCPRLRMEAYEGESLDQQLDDQSDYFINQSGKNVIKKEELKLSKIFDWYGGDFDEKYGSPLGFVKKYAGQEIADDPNVTYIDYNWKLNSPKYMD